MWPDLFGPGWVWGVLTACGILAAGVALVCVLGRPERRDVETEAFQELWRRYEQGDLTRWELERLRPASTGLFFLPVADIAPSIRASNAGDRRAQAHRLGAHVPT